MAGQGNEPLPNDLRGSGADRNPEGKNGTSEHAVEWHGKNSLPVDHRSGSWSSLELCLLKHTKQRSHSTQMTSCPNSSARSPSWPTSRPATKLSAIIWRA